MKKLFISLLTVAATFNLMAQEYTSYAKLTLTGGTTTYDMTVAEGTPENFVDLNTDGVVYMAMYSIYNSVKYQRITLNGELGELPIGFKTKAEGTEYTLSVKSVKGSKTLYLKDLQENIVMALTADMTPYVFTIADNQKNQYIENRFQLYVAPTKDYTRDAATVVGNWYTICVPGGVDEEEYASVMDVYTVGGYDAAQGLAVDPMTEAMQPGVPYIFKAKATEIAFNYNGSLAVEYPQEGANYLTGTFEEIATPAIAYVVANNKLNWAAAGTTVPAYRAYLAVEDITALVPASAAPGRKFLPVSKTMPTGLEGATVNGLQDGTYMVNGQIMIVKDGKTFNVLGL